MTKSTGILEAFIEELIEKAKEWEKDNGER